MGLFSALLGNAGSVKPEELQTKYGRLPQILKLLNWVLN